MSRTAKTSFMINGLLALVLGTTASLAAPLAASAQSYEIEYNTFVARGVQAMENGRYEKASRYLNIAIRSGLSTSQKESVYTNLCAVELMQEQYEQAQEACDNAIRVNAKNWRGFVNRGHAHYALGAFDAARSDYETALRLKPDSTLTKRAHKQFLKAESALITTAIVAENTQD